MDATEIYNVLQAMKSRTYFISSLMCFFPSCPLLLDVYVRPPGQTAMLGNIVTDTDFPSLCVFNRVSQLSSSASRRNDGGGSRWRARSRRRGTRSEHRRSGLTTIHNVESHASKASFHPKQCLLLSC